MLGCCSATRRELRSPMFDPAEHPEPFAFDGNEDGEGAEDEESNNLVRLGRNKARPLDFEKTLSPRPRLLYVGTKLLILGWIGSTVVLSIATATHPSFWLAYLTHWGSLFATAYAAMSFFGAVYLAVRPPANPGVLEGKVGLLVKTTWALLAIAAPAEVLISILYWSLDFDYEEDTVGYVSLMKHGVGMLLIVFDGFVVSRLPLQAKQFILFETFSILYLIWSVIHALANIGNPNTGNNNIYDTLAWKDKTVPTLILSACVLFLLNPSVFLLLRLVSRMPPRRVCREDEGERDPSDSVCLGSSNDPGRKRQVTGKGRPSLAAVKK